MTELLGEQLGNYILVRLIGRGGFGDVYLGEHVYIKTQAAIKVLQLKLANDDMEDFLGEARTIANLKHPHIIRMLDFGIDKGTPYLVMEYATHGTMRQRYPKGTRLSPPVIVPLVQQLADALQYAHHKKLVHRDVKPENILLGETYEALLSDFGIALVAESSRYENIQEMIGTVAYMAPEQLQGKPRPASDQYALGIVVYEWLCGKRPFHGTFTELYSQHFFTPPPPLHEIVDGISPELESVVLTALAKEPHQRFASIKAFATALEQAIEPVLPLVITAQSQALEATLPVTKPRDRPSQQLEIVTQAQEAQPVSLVAQVEEQEARISNNRISRRTLLAGLAALVVVGSASSLVLASKLGYSPTLTPVPTTVFHPDPVPHSDPSPQPDPHPDPRPSSTSRPNPQPDPQPSPQPDPQPSPSPSPRPDPQPSPQTPPLGTTLIYYHGHSNWMCGVNWSPNSNYVVSGSADKTAQVWMAATGQTLNIYRGHTDGVLSVDWSPNGARIVSGGGTNDQTAQVWDAMTGGNVLVYKGHTNQVSAVAWSPDGTRIASGSWDHTVQIWDAATGNHIYTYYGHTAELHDVEWSPDGAYIASASGDHTVRVWNVSTGNTLVVYTGHTDYVFRAVWSPNGAYIASASHDTTAQVWQALSGVTSIVYRGHTNEVNNVVWSSDGQNVASSGADRTVQIWKPYSGNQIYTYRGQFAKTNALAWSPDDTRIVSGDDSASVQVWEAV